MAIRGNYRKIATRRKEEIEQLQSRLTAANEEIERLREDLEQAIKGRPVSRVLRMELVDKEDENERLREDRDDLRTRLTVALGLMDGAFEERATLRARLENPTLVDLCDIKIADLIGICIGDDDGGNTDWICSAVTAMAVDRPFCACKLHLCIIAQKLSL